MIYDKLGIKVSTYGADSENAPIAETTSRYGLISPLVTLAKSALSRVLVESYSLDGLGKIDISGETIEQYYQELGEYPLLRATYNRLYIDAMVTRDSTSETMLTRGDEMTVLFFDDADNSALYEILQREGNIDNVSPEGKMRLKRVANGLVSMDHIPPYDIIGPHKQATLKFPAGNILPVTSVVRRNKIIAMQMLKPDINEENREVMDWIDFTALDNEGRDKLAPVRHLIDPRESDNIVIAAGIPYVVELKRPF